MTTATLLPAYGRDYTSRKAVLADWEAGKDFQMALGPYCSIRDVDAMKKRGITDITFRYKRLTSVAVIKL